jgi:hypothetical protein
MKTVLHQLQLNAISSPLAPHLQVNGEDSTYLDFFERSLLKKLGSFGSLVWPWQRSFFATPLRAISMCWPHPDQLGFPHLRQVVLLHIFFSFS